MSFFSNLFYGGVTVFVGYELYECYKKEEKLDAAALTKCFFSSFLDEGKEEWNSFMENYGGPAVEGWGKAWEWGTGRKEQDDPISESPEGYSGVYFWWGDKDLAISKSKSALEKYNPGGTVETLNEKYGALGTVWTDARFHEVFGDATDMDDPNKQSHDFEKYPYYQSSLKKDKDKDKDKGKKKENWFVKIFKPTNWF